MPDIQRLTPLAMRLVATVLRTREVHDDDDFEEPHVVFSPSAAITYINAEYIAQQDEEAASEWLPDLLMALLKLNVDQVFTQLNYIMEEEGENDRALAIDAAAAALEELANELESQGAE